MTTPSGKPQRSSSKTPPPAASKPHESNRTRPLSRRTGDLNAVTAAGPLNPREFSDVRATDAVLKPVNRDGRRHLLGGQGRRRYAEDPHRTPGHDAAGDDWIGLRRNEQYLVRAVHQVPLLSGPLALILILGALALAWRREGR